MSETDAVGAFVTAGLVANEVDGAPGRNAAHAGEKHDSCPNCGTPAPGHYCPECGQHVHVHRSVRHVLHEAIHGVLHLDGKFWRTLPMLAFKPGKLTRDYVQGKRARYVAPFAIFLFTVFAMYFTFAVFGAPGGGLLSDNVVIDGEQLKDMSADERAAMLGDFDGEIENLRAQIADLEEQIEAAEDPAERAELQGQLRGRRYSLSAAERARNALATGEFDAIGQLRDLANEAAEQEAAAGEEATATFARGVSDALADGDTEEAETSDGDTRVIVDGRELDPETESGALKVLANLGKAFGDEEDMEYFWYKVKQSAYKFSFLLLPLSLPFVWLLFFWRRDIHLYDHTVFILYSLSAMSLLTILMWVGISTGIWGWAVFWLVMIFVPPIHMYKQLKYGYDLSRPGALVRTFVLTQFALIVLGLFFAIVVAIGAS